MSTDLQLNFLWPNHHLVSIKIISKMWTISAKAWNRSNSALRMHVNECRFAEHHMNYSLDQSFHCFHIYFEKIIIKHNFIFNNFIYFFHFKHLFSCNLVRSIIWLHIIYIYFIFLFYDALQNFECLKKIEKLINSYRYVYLSFQQHFYFSQLLLQYSIINVVATFFSILLIK